MDGSAIAISISGTAITQLLIGKLCHAVCNCHYCTKPVELCESQHSTGPYRSADQLPVPAGTVLNLRIPADPSTHLSPIDLRIDCQHLPALYYNCGTLRIPACICTLLTCGSTASTRRNCIKSAEPVDPSMHMHPTDLRIDSQYLPVLY